MLVSFSFLWHEETLGLAEEKGEKAKLFGRGFAFSSPP